MRSRTLPFSYSNFKKGTFLKFCFISGFMTCTMFLSMWISNTASVALMVPIVDSIADAMFEKDDVDIDDIEKTKKPKERTKEEEIKRNLMLLSCAYAANIGGTGVITGEFQRCKNMNNFVYLVT